MFSPSRHQILVVDDEPSIRESIAMMLTFSGYDRLYGGGRLYRVARVEENPTRFDRL
jgi:CheY-like chemotaxis protein